MPRKKEQIENELEQPTSNKPVGSRISILTVLVVLIVIMMGAVIAFLAIQSQKTAKELKQLKEGQVSASPNDETKQLLDEVSKILVLPQNETPTIATVSDLSKLAGQPFFEAAAVGDKVIIYSTSKKAILYRPSEKKVINIAPLTLDAGQQSAPVDNNNNNTVNAQ